MRLKYAETLVDTDRFPNVLIFDFLDPLFSNKLKLNTWSTGYLQLDYPFKRLISRIQLLVELALGMVLLLLSVFYVCYNCFKMQLLIQIQINRKSNYKARIWRNPNPEPFRAGQKQI